MTKQNLIIIIVAILIVVGVVVAILVTGNNDDNSDNNADNSQVDQSTSDTDDTDQDTSTDDDSTSPDNEDNQASGEDDSGAVSEEANQSQDNPENQDDGTTTESQLNLVLEGFGNCESPDAGDEGTPTYSCSVGETKYQVFADVDGTVATTLKDRLRDICQDPTNARVVFLSGPGFFLYSQTDFKHSLEDYSEVTDLVDGVAFATDPLCG